MSAPQVPARRDRTPLILGIIAGILAVAVVIALSVYFLRPNSPASTGSSPAPQAPDSTQADPAPGPTESSSSDAGIDVTATGFTITGEDGESLTHEWADDPQPAIDALTALFGTEPTEDFQNGDAENWAYDVYEWEGFRFFDVFLDGSDRQRSEVPAPTYVSYGTGVPVDVTNDLGIEIGMTPDELDALNPDEAHADGGTAAYLFGKDRATFYADGKRTFGAVVTIDDSSFWITYTYAPEL
ncbi:hypothetical protein [Microbacterium sp. T2.11-28]|uniref:hypothetical protein n=1 Tax=unclassified Microbacterium TaxID=2609290 RepID=UPI00247788DD|nr:hypothetical protein [Microbacterium sp. T2.11-28]CAI9389723.1 hypothetical protein MICABA_01207 [Microbacterium sp. T2.11-28]